MQTKTAPRLVRGAFFWRGQTGAARRGRQNGGPQNGGTGIRGAPANLTRRPGKQPIPALFGQSVAKDPATAGAFLWPLGPDFG